jgi:hypothetical protein
MYGLLRGWIRPSSVRSAGGGSGTRQMLEIFGLGLRSGRGVGASRQWSSLLLFQDSKLRPRSKRRSLVFKNSGKGGVRTGIRRSITAR